jgi:hypothetical protein
MNQPERQKLSKLYLPGTAGGMDVFFVEEGGNVQSAAI